MSNSQKIFEDLSKVMSGAFSTADAARTEMENFFKSGVEKVCNQLELARQEDVDALKDQIHTLRQELDALKNRADNEKAE